MACVQKFFLKDDDVLSVSDFNLSDLEVGTSLYEVVKIINGKALFLEEHILRMRKSATIKKMTIWLTDDEIKQRIFKICKANNLENGRLKFVFRFYEEENLYISFFIQVITPSPEIYETGVNLISIKGKRLTPNAKVINYDLRKFVKAEVIKHNAFEALLVNNVNQITEGSKSNFFLIKDKKVYTPFAKDILVGVTRNYVFDICKKNNIEIIEKDICLNDLKDYNSCFITGTSLGVLFVNKIDNYIFLQKNGLLELISSEYKWRVDNYLKL